MEFLLGHADGFQLPVQRVFVAGTRFYGLEAFRAGFLAFGFIGVASLRKQDFD